MGSEMDFRSDFNLDQKHPQFDLIKKHIERAVQDLFLDSLRNETDQLTHLFLNEDQIESFVNRLLKYWEDLEDYETCNEIISLSEKFKEKWQFRDKIPISPGVERIKKLFDSNR
jgi:hypothetical protein